VLTECALIAFEMRHVASCYCWNKTTEVTQDLLT